MIQVSDLTKAYGGQVLFDRASFTIDPGERVGLVGRNGHGKTTLFRIILGAEQPDGGTVSIPNGYAIGHLSQHLRFSASTVLDEACLALPPSEDFTDLTYRVKTVLQGLGFREDEFTHPPGNLSGGFQVRLNLAKVLVSGPHLLLLDEPTNYLDILSLRWLRQFLLGWKRELMLITHDREFMDSVITHTVGIHRCRMKKTAGHTGNLYEQIIQEEEVFEKTRINDERRRREAEEFINRFRAQANRARAVQSRIKMLRKKERAERLRDIENLDFFFRFAPSHAKWLAAADDLSFSFGNGGPSLITDLSLTIGIRDRVGVIGRNGKGKTTLLNLFSGDLNPSSGSLSFHRDARVACFGQTNVDRLDPDRTIEEEILSANPDLSRQTARGICGAMMFGGDDAMKMIRVLSGGERSRVLLGKLLARPANLLLLDEPTNHLDMEATESLLAAIDAFDGAVMIVTHSEMILRAVATRLIVFDDHGVSVFDGTYDDFLDRVGWRNERPAASAAATLPDRKRTAGTKELRRARAEIIAERGRVIGALGRRIAATESAIISLERELAQATAALVEASAGGNGPAIQTHAKTIHDCRARIDALFATLESLTSEHEAKTRAFGEQLAALGT